MMFYECVVGPDPFMTEGGRFKCIYCPSHVNVNWLSFLVNISFAFVKMCFPLLDRMFQIYQLR